MAEEQKHKKTNGREKDKRKCLKHKIAKKQAQSNIQMNVYFRWVDIKLGQDA